MNDRDIRLGAKIHERYLADVALAVFVHPEAQIRPRLAWSLLPLCLDEDDAIDILAGHPVERISKAAAKEYEQRRLSLFSRVVAAKVTLECHHHEEASVHVH